LAEFTGERVIAGQVDPDLWNEHMARYQFASRLCRHKRVADLACGTGYGAAHMACQAQSVIALDISTEAIAHAVAGYTRANLSFLQASCSRPPLPDGAFGLVTAFEVIEHLKDWPTLLTEARRLLQPGGQFLVSTPNKSYYAESRSVAGPNPYHEHEFTYEEFRQALGDVFPHVSLFAQNHAGSVTFQPMAGSAAAEVRMEASAPDAEHAHFFLAVCALAPQTGAPTFVYLPRTTNVLREREQHIGMLDQELAQKNAWLEQSQAEHNALVHQHREQTAELEARNRWADQLNQQLAEAAERVQKLQQELAVEQKAALENVAAYEAKILELEQDNHAKTEWANSIEGRLSGELAAKGEELKKCIQLLDEAEKTVEERTLWAQSLDRQRQELEQRLALVQASRWHRMGRRFGLGPEVGNS